MTLIEVLDAEVEHRVQEVASVRLSNLRKDVLRSIQDITLRFGPNNRQQWGPHLDALLDSLRIAAVDRARAELYERAVQNLLSEAQA